MAKGKNLTGNRKYVIFAQEKGCEDSVEEDSDEDHTAKNTWMNISRLIMDI